MRIKDKVAIVTGAGRGIGEGIALRFAEEGAKVVVNDVNEADVNRTVETIKGKGGKAVAVVGSVTSREVAQRMVDTAVKEFGTVDILVNNAGITRDAMLHKMSDEQWDQVIDVNLKGVFLGIQCTARVMREKGYGKIINMSSVTGPMVGSPSGGQTAYGATKAAVIGFTKALALETAQYGINVNAVLPGYIYSPSALGLRGGAAGRDAEESMREFGYKVPMGRQGTPEDVGELVLFLASDASSYLTGSEIVIDGGNILQEEYLGPYRPK